MPSDPPQGNPIPEGLLRDICRSAPIAVLVLDGWTVRFANRFAADCFGEAVDALVGRNLRDLVSAETRARLSEAPEGLVALSPLTMTVTGSGDVTADLEVVVRRVDFDGAPLTVLYGTDESMCRGLHRQLERSERRHRQVVESAREMFVVVDPEGKVLLANAAVTETLGFGRDEFMELDPFTRLHPEQVEDIRRDMADVVEGNVRQVEFEWQAADGSWRWIEASMSPYTVGEDRPAVLVIARDQTQRKRVEQQMLQTQKMESIGLLASGLTHDFNNIIGGILGFASLLLLKLKKENPELLRYAERIIDGSKRIGDLSKQLLAFARGGKYQDTNMSANDCIESVIQLMRPSMPDEVTFELDLEEKAWPIQGDISQMEQVFMAVFQNAVDAMDLGGSIRVQTRNVTEERSREDALPRTGRQVVIGVTDQGRGIPKSIVGKVFEPFFTTKPERKGMGLAAAYGIVQNHGGWIVAESRPGRGATFRMGFPTDKEHVPGTREPKARSPRRHRLAATVMVVDDNDLMRDSMIGMLEQLGYRTIACASGEQAVAAAGKNTGRIDICLLDVNMPDIDGRETQRQLRRADPELKVIVCTVHDDVRARVMLNEAATDLLLKPFGLEQLDQALRKALAE